MRLQDMPDWALTKRQLIGRQKNHGLAKKRASRNRSKGAIKRWRKTKINTQSCFGTLEGEDETLKLILEMASMGRRPFAIADYLNCRGIASRGKRWYETTINRIVEHHSVSGGPNMSNGGGSGTDDSTNSS